MSIPDMLELAYFLSILTYYLGVLVLALPIPVYGLKKWSYMLMKDSILSMSLVLLYTTLITYSNEFSTMIGADWNSYYQWLDSMVMLLDRQRTILIIIYGALKTVSMAYIIGDLLGPILRMISYNIIGIYTYKLFGFFIEHYSSILLVLGILLVSIPFRIGRNAGAWLIAFSLVMYVALPAMPLFVNSFPLPEGQWNGGGRVMGIAYPIVEILDSNSHRVKASGVFEAYYYNSSENSYELIARHLAIHGTVDTAKPERGLPGLTEYLTYIIIDGIVFSLEPFPVPPESYQFKNGTLTLTLQTEYLVCSFDNNIIVYRGSKQVLYSGTCEDETLDLQFSLPPGSYFEIRIPDTVTYQLNYSGDAAIETGEWSWNGLHGVYVRFYNDEGFSVQQQIYLTILSSSDIEVNVDEYCYIKDYLGVDIYSLHFIISNIFFRVILLPLMYIILLTLIVSNVAYLIAGKYVGYRVPARL